MIHVACNIDSNYVKHCAVTLVSLFENNKEPISVHILANGLTVEEQKILIHLAEKYDNKVFFYAPDDNLLKGFTIRKFSKRISMATYYRCILADILPKNIDRLLYIDCDIVILGNISDFWNTPLDGIGVAAVEDIGCGEKERYEILKYPMEDSYFNAGVLMINLRYWREQQVGRACIDYFHDYPERILFNDQDLLNSILHKSKVLVDLRWNVQDGFYRNPKNITQEWRTKYEYVLKNPVILHYTNRKPWDYDSQHPLREEYFKYLDMTPWKGDRPSHSIINRCKRFFKLLPFHLGIRKAKYVDLSK